MSSVTFTGLATGLDTSSIVAQLVELKRRPVYRLESRRDDFKNQLTALSALRTKLLALQDAAARLDSIRDFNAYGTTSSHENILTATAGATAAPGRYDIFVESLATARKDISQGYASADAVVGEGTIWFNMDGAAVPLTLPAGTTLAELKDMINSDIDGISASLINDGSSGTPFTLVLSGENEGSSGDFTIHMASLSGGIPPVLTNIQTAADARLSVDGILVTAGSNQASEVISGLTLDLHQAEAGTKVTLQVEMDSAQIEESIKALVDARNDLYAFIQENGAVDGDSR